jgi:hypothetical protein
MYAEATGCAQRGRSATAKIGPVAEEVSSPRRKRRSSGVRHGADNTRRLPAGTPAKHMGHGPQSWKELVEQLDRRFRALENRIAVMRRELDEAKQNGAALRTELMRKMSIFEWLPADDDDQRRQTSVRGCLML